MIMFRCFNPYPWLLDYTYFQRSHYQASFDRKINYRPGHLASFILIIATIIELSLLSMEKSHLIIQVICIMSKSKQSKSHQITFIQCKFCSTHFGRVQAGKPCLKQTEQCPLILCILFNKRLFKSQTVFYYPFNEQRLSLLLLFWRRTSLVPLHISALFCYGLASFSLRPGLLFTKQRSRNITTPPNLTKCCSWLTVELMHFVSFVHSHLSSSSRASEATRLLYPKKWKQQSYSPSYFHIGSQS